MTGDKTLTFPITFTGLSTSLQMTIENSVRAVLKTMITSEERDNITENGAKDFDTAYEDWFVKNIEPRLEATWSMVSIDVGELKNEIN